MTRTRLFIFLFLLLNIAGCKKMYDMEGNFQVPGVAVTFDDNSVRCWNRNMNFLDSLGIKATFYVSAYHKLSTQEKQLLKNIQARGHEIEYHTTNHRDLAQLLYRKGWDAVYNEEIKPDLEMMRADGFNINHFAYPFGKHCEFLDNKLINLFYSIRALDGTRNNNNCFALSSKSRILYSMGIDESSGPTTEKLEEKMQKAITDKKCLVLLGHEIDNRGYQFATRKETLRFIARYVREHSMRFYLLNEIAAK
jgi:peptidoglycan-N-acetylglucosamine deacetylase